MPADFADHRRATYFLWWKPIVGFGHAALIIDSVAFSTNRQANVNSLLADSDAGMPYDFASLLNDNYVSWYGSTKGFFLTGLRAQKGTYVTDELLTQKGEPSKIVEMTELDFNAMRGAWHEIRDKAKANWKLFDKNCSTVVARVLKAGGGDTFCRNKSKSHPLFWTPGGCYEYAKAIAKHGGAAGAA